MVTEVPESINCPRCSESKLHLAREKNTGIEVAQCPKCRGLWFRAGDLPKLLRLPAEMFQIPGSALHVSRRCPACVVRMMGFRFPDSLFEIEVCEKCGGLWLDEGEYEQIRALQRR